MRIDILDGAEKDLVEGFEFYERQSVGIKFRLRGVPPYFSGKSIFQVIYKMLK